MSVDAIQIAMQLKQELDQLPPLSPEQEARIMQKFRLDWNYHSNNLEGNSLSYGEAKALIMFGVTAQGKPLKDHFEITGHNEAIKWVEEVVKGDYPLTEMFIRELHVLLLKESYDARAITPDGNATKRRIEVGRYKSAPNHVQTITGEIFYFASPEETPAKMHDLIEWYREESEKPDVNPIILAAEFHYQFIRIHPFDDGNGRSARILMNFILMKSGFPPAIIKTQDKQNYFNALRQADADNFPAFVEYIAENLVRSLEIMIAGAKGENIEEQDDVYKEAALLKQRLNAIGNVIEHRTAETLNELFDNAIVKAYDTFLPNFLQFADYYFTVDQTIEIDGTSRRLGERYSTIHIAKKQITNNLNRIILRFTYERFKLEGFKEFSHTAQIVWEFQKTYYTTNFDGGKIYYRHSYGEYLSLDQINELGKAIIEEHKNLIEKKLAEINTGRAHEE
ncbi:Fic family protein [Chitinophaga pinensis]|uniref:Fic family protein n=1 Tax=Chitinophaga pinensis TaxID=79329 RepID=A0A5C6LMA7_9BACT|nr:Fic family protein [Chitinophaga pinensis]TWV93976.1 Fic family protein [Chitinophaga pinensis]